MWRWLDESFNKQRSLIFLLSTFCHCSVFLAGCNKWLPGRRSVCMLSSYKSLTDNLLAINLGSLTRRRKFEGGTLTKKGDKVLTFRAKLFHYSQMSVPCSLLVCQRATFKLFLRWFLASLAPRAIRPQQRALQRGALPSMRSCVKNWDWSYDCL